MSESTRFKFDSLFLKAAIMRLVLEPYLIDKFREMMSPDLFDIGDQHSSLRTVAKVVLERSKTEEVSGEGVWAWLQLLPSGAGRDAAVELFSDMRLDSDLLKFARSDQVFETFLQYLKATTFINNHKKVKDSFDKANFEHAYSEFENILSKIKEISLEEDEILNWDNASALLSKFSETKFNNFELGIEDFDKDAGFEPQSFNIFIAASGGGKTMLSIHMAVQAIKQGKKAFLAFCEDKSPTILRRLYAAYTGIEIGQLKSYHQLPKEFRERVDKATEVFKKYLHVEFIYGKSHKFIIEKVKNMNEKMRIEGKPRFEIFVLDYIGHIAHLAPGDKVHEKLHRACSDLKDFALQTGLIVITHFQTNREGASKSREGTGLIDMSTIASSFNSAFVADNILSINRPEELAEENKCIIYVVKGREGAADRKYEVPTEFNRARFDMKEARLISSYGDF